MKVAGVLAFGANPNARRRNPANVELLWRTFDEIDDSDCLTVIVHPDIALGHTRTRNQKVRVLDDRGSTIPTLVLVQALVKVGRQWGATEIVLLTVQPLVARVTHDLRLVLRDDTSLTVTIEVVDVDPFCEEDAQWWVRSQEAWERRERLMRWLQRVRLYRAVSLGWWWLAGLRQWFLRRSR